MNAPHEGDIPRRNPSVPGDPTASGLPEPDASRVRPQPPADGPRRGAGLLGIPDEGPRDGQPIGPAENLFQREEPLTDQEFEEALCDATRRTDPAAAILGTAGKWPILVLVISATTLLILAQAVSLVNQLQRLPLSARIGGYALLGLLIGGIAWALWRLIIVFARMRATPRFYIQTLRRLSERAELRRLANERLHEARLTLRQFLSDYPLERSAAAVLLARCLTNSDLETLRANVLGLLGEEHATTEGWLEQFDRQFLSYLDAAARNRISRYAKRVGLLTAALPSGLDAPVVLLNAYLLAGELCVIYNLRTGATGTAAVLLRVLFNAFAASHASEWTESVADTLFQGGGLVAGAGKAVAARAAEGGANYFLYRRLGAAMVRYLRPVWPPYR